MSLSYIKQWLLCTPLLLTPLFVLAQSNTDYGFSFSQFCAIDDAGELTCTVADGFSRISPPSNVPALTAVTVGQSHACGITLAGQPFCWGENRFGQLNAPVVTAPLLQIDAGGDYTCALDVNNEAVCWGLNTNLQLDPPDGVTFSHIDAAELETCGVTTDAGDPICWSNDPRRSAQGLTGPFVELDLRSGAVCGLTDDGDIKCADNSVAEPPILPVTPHIIPPDNGPYIDLAATREAVCGLQIDGTLDCNFRVANRAAGYPLGEQFLSIQSSDTDFLTDLQNARASASPRVGAVMCGQRTDRTFQCWDQGEVSFDLSLPVDSNAVFVQNFALTLDARIYSPTAVEIFWTPVTLDATGQKPSPQPIVEVYRNGELIASQPSRFSHFDDNPAEQADYQIRLIDDAGNAGPLSGILTVDTTEQTVLFNGEPTLSASQVPIDTLPDVFTTIRIEDLRPVFVVAWEVNPELESSIDGYEIILNGTPVGFTRSTLYVDAVARNSRCVEIVAVGFNQELLGATGIGSGCL